MARAVRCHHDGCFLTAMSRGSAGVAVVRSSLGSGVAIAASTSMSEEAPTASRVMHRSLEVCVQQATEETSMEVCWQR